MPLARLVIPIIPKEALKSFSLALPFFYQSFSFYFPRSMPFFKKIRFFWNLICLFFKRHYLSFFVSLLLGSIVFLVISKITPILTEKLPEFKRSRKIGIIGKYQLEELPSEILSLISLGLTENLENGLVKPALAESWRIDEAGKKYTFKLKENIFWQDGTPILSKDINYQFKGLRKEIIDDKTFSFSLEEPFAPFLNVVSRPVFKKELVGAGPYLVKKVKKQGEIINLLILNGPNENIFYRFYPTKETAITAFKLGEINHISELLANPFSDKWQANLEVKSSIKDNQFVTLLFNLKKDTILSDKALRQALAYALKKDYKYRCLSPISSKSWAYNPEVKPFDFSEEKAKEFFKKVHEGEEKLQLEISTPESLLADAETIKTEWEKTLKVSVSIKTINLLSSDFQILLTSEEVPVDPDQYSLWHSTQGGKLLNFENPKIDKLLEDGRKILDEKERKEKYLDFQKFLVEEIPAIFLYHPVVYHIERK